MSPRSLPYGGLPAEQAYELSVRNYLTVATAALWGIDFVLSMPGDYRMRMAYKIAPPCYAHATARLSSLVAVVYSLIYAVTPLSHCDGHEIAIGAFTTLSIFSSTLLVLLRVRATFHGSQCICRVYVVLWLTHVALTITANFGANKERAAPIGKTGFCAPSGVNWFHTASAALLCLYHVVVFMGLSLRLSSVNRPATPSSSAVDLRGKFQQVAVGALSWKTLVLGNDLPQFTKAMLRDAQTYYTVTLASSVMCIVMTTIHRDSVYQGSLFNLPNVAIMNVMACRVYRDTKLKALSNTGALPICSNPPGPLDICSPMSFERRHNVSNSCEGFGPATSDKAEYKTPRSWTEPIQLSTFHTRG